MKTKPILTVLYPVTIGGEMWELRVFGHTNLDNRVSIYVPLAQKIAQSGRMVDVPVYMRGPYFALLKSGMQTFSRDCKKSDWKKPLGTPSARLAWGNRTKDPIAGLFLEQQKALDASQEKNLTPGDPRFEEDTLDAIQAAGFDHPFFLLRSEGSDSFLGLLFRKVETNPSTIQEFPETDTTVANMSHLKNKTLRVTGVSQKALQAAKDASKEIADVGITRKVTPPPKTTLQLAAEEARVPLEKMKAK